MSEHSIIYTELKKNATLGKFIECPLLFFDDKLPVPWDFQHSSIYNMLKYLGEHPREIKQRYRVLFGAYLFEYDYDKG